MLKIFALILAWIALTSCSLPESKSCIWILKTKARDYQCKLTPEKQGDNFISCYQPTRQGVLIRQSEVLGAEEMCF